MHMQACMPHACLHQLSPLSLLWPLWTLGFPIFGTQWQTIHFGDSRAIFNLKLERKRITRCHNGHILGCWGPTGAEFVAKIDFHWFYHLKASNFLILGRLPGLLWQRDVCDRHQELGTRKSTDPVSVESNATEFPFFGKPHVLDFVWIYGTLLGSLLGLRY